MIEFILDLIILVFLLVVAVTVIRLRDLFAVVMLFGIYSFLSATFFVLLDAVDVAFTEAAVGAGVATMLMLATLALTERREKRPTHTPLIPLMVVLATGALLVYGTTDMPAFGSAAAPVHTHVAPHYLYESPKEIGIPNVVTAVLASYRGFDTLGEVVVVFTAGVGVLTLLGFSRRERDESENS